VLTGNKSLPGGQPKVENWLPKGQIGKKVTVEHCTLLKFKVNQFHSFWYSFKSTELWPYENRNIQLLGIPARRNCFLPVLPITEENYKLRNSVNHNNASTTHLGTHG